MEHVWCEKTGDEHSQGGTRACLCSRTLISLHGDALAIIDSWNNSGQERKARPPSQRLSSWGQILLRGRRSEAKRLVGFYHQLALACPSQLPLYSGSGGVKPQLHCLLTVPHHVPHSVESRLPWGTTSLLSGESWVDPSGRMMFWLEVLFIGDIVSQFQGLRTSRMWSVSASKSTDQDLAELPWSLTGHFLFGFSLKSSQPPLLVTDT